MPHLQHGTGWLEASVLLHEQIQNSDHFYIRANVQQCTSLMGGHDKAKPVLPRAQGFTKVPWYVPTWILLLIKAGNRPLNPTAGCISRTAIYRGQLPYSRGASSRGRG